MTIPKFNDLVFTTVRTPMLNHPVYILRGPTGHAFVLKMENFTVTWAQEGLFRYTNPYVMEGAVTPEAQQARLAGLGGIEEFKKSYEFMAATFAACTERFPEARTVDPFELANVFSRLGAYNSAHNNELFDGNFINSMRSNKSMTTTMWTIMDCLEGLYDLRSMAEKKLNTDAGARQAYDFVRNNPATGLNLGRILALDVFFANNDRATFTVEDGVITGHMGNPGNFFLMNTNIGGRCEFVGIDFFYSASGFANLFKAPPPRVQEVWPGRLLKEGKTKQKAELDKVLDELNQYLTAGGFQALFDGGHKTNVAEGFRDGASKLKKYLDKETGKPSEVKARKHLLGW